MTTYSQVRAAAADRAGGHSAATLYEAAKQPITLDPRLQAAWPGARLSGPAFTVQDCGGDNLALHFAVLAAPTVLDAADARVAHERDILAQLRAGATTVDLYGLPSR